MRRSPGRKFASSKTFQQPAGDRCDAINPARSNGWRGRLKILVRGGKSPALITFTPGQLWWANPFLPATLDLTVAGWRRGFGRLDRSGANPAKERGVHIHGFRLVPAGVLKVRVNVPNRTAVHQG